MIHSNYTPPRRIGVIVNDHSHPTTDELVMIESYYHQKYFVAMIAERLRRSRQPIYNVINFLKQGNSAIDYYKRYKVYKKRCGRHKIILPKKQQKYIKEKVAQGWTPTSTLEVLNSQSVAQ